MKVTRTKKLELIVLLVVVLLGRPFQSARAGTQYVTDMLILNLRDTPDEDYKVITRLKSNTPVEALEERGRYLKVRTEEGEEGWVPKQYVTSKRPKHLIIAKLKKNVGRLEIRVEDLEKARSLVLDELKAAKEKHAAAVKIWEDNTSDKEKRISCLSRDLRQITDKYKTLLEQSENVAALVGERDDLQAAARNVKTKNDRLKADVKTLRKKNDRVKRRGVLLWFLAGACVFFVGLIAGRASRKKKIFY
ncbi:MAG: TIGR04211 family SH3 domain-containing protein [Deltaproteobacteria bacterium]|nr:TIGR04211 family SH3 domain-containing protein [Deltaproteobacteria bacterium]